MVFATALINDYLGMAVITKHSLPEVAKDEENAITIQYNTVAITNIQ